jgi:deoxyribonuclease IV
MKLLLGAHMSIAGGLDQALLRGRALDCATIQLFTKNASQWKERTLGPDEIDGFRKLRLETGISPIISHGGYLVNLASPEPPMYERSLQAVVHELQRCDSLGIDYLVLHPGAHRGAGRSKGIRRIIEAIDSIHQWTIGLAVEILLETTAGQGTYIGSCLEEIAEILNGIAEPHRIGFCIDTCHLFAAGYRLETTRDCARLFTRIEKVAGLSRLKAIHLNDSLGERGSRTDRHAHIARGKIGARAFRWIMKNPSLEKIPKIIETPKKEDMDQGNLELLRSYAGG